MHSYFDDRLASVERFTLATPLSVSGVLLCASAVKSVISREPSKLISARWEAFIPDFLVEAIADRSLFTADRSVYPQSKADADALILVSVALQVFCAAACPMCTGRGSSSEP